jgi:hypothetical protein
MSWLDASIPGKTVDPGFPPGYAPTPDAPIPPDALMDALQRALRDNPSLLDNTSPGQDTPTPLFPPNLPDYHQLMAPGGWTFPIYNGPLNIRYRSVG